MKKTSLIILLSSVVLSACSTTTNTNEQQVVFQTSTTPVEIKRHHHNIDDLILQAETNSTGKVRDILHTTRQMALVEQTIIKGGCWDYLDAAWTRAGVPRQNRQTIFKSTKSGPYANTNQLQAGDWLYYVNYSYNNIEHSGMFIAWLDEDEKLGITLSYAGESRQEPARYKVYDLSGVYHIMRAK
ncbi:MAG: hypothetical protein IKI22_03505 [Neisseriaceae bacterium]|nr:hypothetical protein [Neisseriaceae bacterium]